MAVRKPRSAKLRAEDIAREMVRAEHALIRARYQAARLAVEAKAAGTYGAAAVPNLAKVLNVDPTTLYHYATVAETWDEETLERFLIRGSLTWSHLLALVAVTRRKTRDALTRRVVNEGLSARALLKIIREL